MIMPSNSVWTVDCFDQLTTQRMDPIKFPGQAEAGHVHAIVGASKFELDCDFVCDLKYEISFTFTLQSADYKFQCEKN